MKKNKLFSSSQSEKEQQTAPKSNYSIFVSSAKSTSASAGFLPCRHIFQEGFWQGMDWSLIGNSEETQQQHHLVQICMTRPRAQSCSVAAQETGSELKSESNKGVYSHNPLLHISRENHVWGVDWRSYGGTRIPCLRLKISWHGRYRLICYSLCLWERDPYSRTRRQNHPSL